MRITSTGCVGIGTTSVRSNSLLDVYGAGVFGTSGYGFYVGTDATGAFLDAGTQLIRMFAGQQERIRIQSDGNVGIGTDAPILKLVVKGTSSYPATTGTAQTGVFRLTGGTGLYNVLDMGINESTDTAWIQATRANSLSTYDKLLINPYGGNVGIGTTSVSFKLDVYSDTNTEVGRFYNNATSCNFYVGSTNNTAQTDIILYTSTGNAQFFKNRSNTSWGGADSLNIYTSNGAIAFHPAGTTNAVYIANNGNVGIGTTSPGSLLQVYGTSPFIRISNSAAANHGIKISYGDSDTHGLHLIYQPHFL
jgi:uncharacterized membrane protein